MYGDHYSFDVTADDYPGFEAGDATVIWRYMSTKRFQDLLSGHLYFAAARQFDDDFEGAITEAQRKWRESDAGSVFPESEQLQASHLEALSHAFEDLRRMTKINCWHASAHENVAMWERYLPHNADGVAVRSTVGGVKHSIQEFRLQPSYGEEQIRVGLVHYIDYSTEEMIDRSMLGIFLHKRIEFRDEGEVRFLLSLRRAAEYGVPISDDGVMVQLDLDLMVDEIRVGPSMTNGAAGAVQDALSQAGLNCPVRRSVLARKPTY